MKKFLMAVVMVAFLFPTSGITGEPQFWGFDWSSFDSDLIPSADDTYDLGSSSKEWKDLYVDGVGYIDSVSADALDVTGVTDTNIPQVDATGFVDSPLTTDGTDVTNTGAYIAIAESEAAQVELSVFHDTEATAPVFVGQKADGTQASPSLVDDNAVLVELRGRGYDGSGYHVGGYAMFRANGDPSDGTDMPTEFVIATTKDGEGTPTEHFFVDDSGNVGIGNSNPASGVELDILATSGDGDIRLTGFEGGGVYISMLADEGDDFDDKWQMYVLDGGAGFHIRDDSGDSWVTNFSVLNNGNVGIGETSPTAKLEVAGTIASQPVTFAFTTEVNITDPLTTTILLLDGDNDGENDAIDLQNGTTAGQFLHLIAAADIDADDTCTINMADTTCTNCPAIVFDKVGENAYLIWTGATWVVSGLQSSL